jgi:hypothetical protein
MPSSSGYCDWDGATSRKKILTATPINFNAMVSVVEIGRIGTLLPVDSVIGELVHTHSLKIHTAITTKSNARAIAMGLE